MGALRGTFFRIVYGSHWGVMRPKRIRKKEDKYISTREAAKMLGIAMSTVYRYFDWGILTGEQHPVTHLRKIDKASVLALMRTYGMKWEEQS